MNNNFKAGVDYIGLTTPFYCHDGKGNFLVHKRSQQCRDEQGTWDFGGGKVEFGLTPQENVLKEVKEEYGCEGIIDLELPFYNIFRENNGKQTHWLALPFFVKVDPSLAKNNEPESIDEVKWVRLSELPNPLHKGAALALEKYKNEFKKFGELKE